MALMGNGQGAIKGDVTKKKEIGGPAAQLRSVGVFRTSASRRQMSFLRFIRVMRTFMIKDEIKAQ